MQARGWRVSTRTRKDWILWAQLGCALVVTFHAEYTLALAAGVNEYVALAVPGALDLYVIRALQKHRDVFAAVLVMVLANVASHLVSAGLIPVGWAVYSAVGGTVPLLLWRGHALRQETAGQGVVSTSVPVDEYAAGTDTGTPYPDEVQVHPLEYAPGYEPGTLRVHLPGCPATHPDNALCSEYVAPDHVPAAWVRPNRFMTPDEYAEYETEWLTGYGEEKTGTVPYLTPVPDLPAEYETGTVHSDSPLIDSDWEYVDRAKEYVAGTERPTVKGIRDALGIGQARAQRLLEHLEVKR